MREVNDESINLRGSNHSPFRPPQFARTSHCSVAGWRRLLVVTSEFHMPRTRAIFEWVFGVGEGERYDLEFLSTANDGLSDAEVGARVEREEKSMVNVRENLSKKYTTMRGVHEFLTRNHDLYNAEKLVERGSREAAQEVDDTTRKSYGG